MNFSARLLEWLFAPFIFLWAVGLAVAFWNARATVDASLDDRLTVVARALAEDWQQHGVANVSRSFPSEQAQRWLNGDGRYPIRYALYTEQYEPILGAPELTTLLEQVAPPRVSIDDAQREIDVTHPLRGANATMATGDDEAYMRVLLLRLRVRYDDGELSDPGRVKYHILLITQSRERQATLLRTLMLNEALAQTAILLVAVYLMWFSFNHVVRPVAALKAHLDARRADDLSPLPEEHAPQEIAPLVAAMNELMRRLQGSVGAQKRFIANAAHQLRTPMAALRMQSELLQQLPDGPERDQSLRRLVATGERASRLATQLLTLARAESAGTTSIAQTVDLNLLCEEIAHDVVETALIREIDFGFVGSEQPVTVTGDATLLGEMVRNLVDNAFKYVPRNGHVLLTVLADPAQLIVEDSGPGVPESEHTRVFAPFTRVVHLDSETGQAIGGTGLGLAIVHEVVQAHGGRISIERSEWGGARFVVSFKKD